MNMLGARIPVDVVMERVPLRNRWASERWQPAAVVPVDASFATRAPFERLDDEGDRARWRCGGCEVDLHRSEAEGYFLNLTSPEPKVFVLWRTFEGAEPPARPVVVTVSYNEAARFLDAGEQVDGVALPETLAQWMRVFVQEHYKPEPRRKRGGAPATTRSNEPREPAGPPQGRTSAEAPSAEASQLNAEIDSPCHNAARPGTAS